MKHIYVEVEALWDVFEAEKEELVTHLKPVAENTQFGVVVYLTEDNDYPMLVVYMDDQEVYREPCISEDDCIVTARKIYSRYILDTNSVLSDVINAYSDADDTEYDAGDDEEDQDDRQDDSGIPDDDELDEEHEQYRIETEIEEREAEIEDAFQDFMYIVLEQDLGMFLDDPEEIYSDIKEHILEYIARKWGLAIRRPMLLEDEDGEEFYEEYPYECMEFDDEDDPIYK